MMEDVEGYKFDLKTSGRPMLPITENERDWFGEAGNVTWLTSHDRMCRWDVHVNYIISSWKDCDLTDKKESM